ncbi:MAG TPA: hypothetical protein VNC85_03500 [Mycobacteriales bacterium]|nr:hypothetical protein [Mycobacteriales bacterium]
MSNDRVDRGGPTDDRQPADRGVDDSAPQNTTASRLFDLRTIIGALFVLYGLILIIAGLFDTDAEIAKADGIRINLWLGLAMLVLGGLFLLWVRLRPLRIERGPSAAERAGISEGPPEA